MEEETSLLLLWGKKKRAAIQNCHAKGNELDKTVFGGVPVILYMKE
jgi:hypothetical protein